MRFKTGIRAGESGGGGGAVTVEEMQTVLEQHMSKNGIDAVPGQLAAIDVRMAEFESRIRGSGGGVERPAFWGTEHFAIGVPQVVRPGIQNRVQIAFSDREAGEVFPGQFAAQSFRCGMLAAFSAKDGGQTITAAQWALKLHGETHPVTVALSEMAKNALQDDQLRSDRVSKIGVTIPDMFLPGLVEFLRPRTVFLAASPLLVPLTGGKATYLVQDEGTSFSYVETEDSIPDRTSVSFAERAMVAKILKGIVVFSLRALERSTVVTDAFILNDMLAGASAAIDSAALLSDGTLARPKGLTSLIDASHTLTAVVLTAAMAPAARITNVVLDIRKGKQKIADASIDPQRLVYFTSWRDFDFFAEQRTNDGAPAWPSVMQNGTLGGIPLFWTTRITTTGDPGGIGSTLILVDMAEVMFAEEQVVNVRTSFDGSLTDSSQDSGSYHLFERSAGAMLLEAFHDIEMRRSKAGHIWNDVNWGGVGAS